MNSFEYYDLLLFIVNLDLNFSSIFSRLDEDLYLEIINYIDFLKKSPTLENFKKYNISQEAFDIFLDTVLEIIKKSKSA